MGRDKIERDPFDFFDVFHELLISAMSVLLDKRTLITHSNVQLSGVPIIIIIMSFLDTVRNFI